MKNVKSFFSSIKKKKKSKYDEYGKYYKTKHSVPNVSNVPSISHNNYCDKHTTNMYNTYNITNINNIHTNNITKSNNDEFDKLFEICNGDMDLISQILNDDVQMEQMDQAINEQEKSDLEIAIQFDIEDKIKNNYMDNLEKSDRLIAQKMQDDLNNHSNINNDALDILDDPVMIDINEKLNNLHLVNFKRINNKQLLLNFKKKISEFYEKYGYDLEKVSIRLDFHGTTHDKARNISKKGFYAPNHPKYKMAVGLLHGDGIYVTPDMSCARSYGSHIIVAAVILGKSDVSKRGRMRFDSNKAFKIWVLKESCQVLPVCIVPSR